MANLGSYEVHMILNGLVQMLMEFRLSVREADSGDFPAARHDIPILDSR